MKLTRALQSPQFPSHDSPVGLADRLQPTPWPRAGCEVSIAASASSPDHRLIEGLHGIHISRVRMGVPAARAFGTTLSGPIARPLWQ